MGRPTPLHAEHVKAGGRMVDFAGWDLPVQYGSIVAEHQAVRAGAGLFDVSHMGRLAVSGPGAADFLEGLVTSAVAGLAPGRCAYAALTNERGGCLDDLYVYRRAADSFFLVVNAATREKDWAWLAGRRDQRGGPDLEDFTAATAMLALQGPRAVSLIAGRLAAPVPERFGFVETAIDGTPATVSRTGYTGEDGVELWLAADAAPDLWRGLVAAGAAPAGLGARDTLRLEAGYSLYGHELTEEITPIEAGIGFAVARDKAFPGSEILARQRAAGPKRRIAAFELTGRGVPRADYPVAAAGRPVGRVTSGCWSPTLEKGIGLALVEAAAAEIGGEIAVEIRGRPQPARVVARPFYSAFKRRKK